MLGRKEPERFTSAPKDSLPWKGSACHVFGGGGRCLGSLE